MAEIGKGGDILCNFDLTGWLIGCHSSWDLRTTVTGDLALTKDETENNRQRLLMWMALPKGERLDPSLGCCIHDYFHEKITGNVSRRLALDMRSDLKQVFPDLDIKNISIDKVSGLEGGNTEVVASISLGNDGLQFVANWNEIMSINEEMTSIIYNGGLR